MKRVLAGAASAFLFTFVAASALAQVTPFTTIAVGNGPDHVIGDMLDNKVFVVNMGSDSVSVIDPVTWTKLTDIPTGSGPRRAVMNGSTRKVYVANSTGASVTVINAVTSAVITTIALPTGTQPWNLAVDQVHNKVYVPLRTTHEVAVIDGSTDTLVTTVQTGNNVRTACVNTTTNRVYVTAFASNNVTVFDGATNAIVAGSPIAVGAGPISCLVDETTNRVFVGNFTDGTIMAIDGATNTAGSAIASGPSATVCALNVALNLLITINDDGTAHGYDLDTLTPNGHVNTGSNPTSCFIDQAARAAYVTNGGDNTLSVVSLFDGSVHQVATGTGPVAAAIQFQNVYVVNQNNGGAGSVSVVKRFSFSKSADMDGDGKADLLWRNGNDGSVAGWLMDGVNGTAAAILTGAGSWVPVLKGDFNGNGNGDIVWRNTTTNATAMWLMNGLVPGAAATILGPNTFYPLHAASFDATGRSGILWVDSASGQVVIWLMNGTLPSYKQTIYAGSAAWTPILLGNFDGNFHADILWHNTDGSVAIWLMQGNANLGVSVKASATILGPGTNWVPTFMADFDGDGRTDILWTNLATGDTAIWLMNGLAPKPGGTAVIMSGATGWRVTGVPDLDGDLKTDLLWRNINTGATAAWLMDGLAPKPGGTAILFSDPTWIALQPRYTAGLLQTDLVWQNTVTGATALWIMDGLTATSTKLLTTSGPWSVVQYYQDLP